MIYAFQVFYEPVCCAMATMGFAKHPFVEPLVAPRAGARIALRTSAIAAGFVGTRHERISG